MRRRKKNKNFFSLFTDDELLYLLREKAKELGRTPKVEDINKDYNLPPPSLYRERFGSIGEAQRRAGLQVLWRKYTKEEVLNLLKMKIEETGYSPTYREIWKDKRLPHDSKIYVRMFGGLGNALRLIGYEPRSKGLSDSELLRRLEEKIKEKGRLPTYKEIEEEKTPYFPCYRTYMERFGGIYKALVKIVGGDPNNLPSYITDKEKAQRQIYLCKFAEMSNEELLSLLKERCAKLGRMLRIADFRNVKDPTLPPFSLIKKRFGNISKLKVLLGYKKA